MFSFAIATTLAVQTFFAPLVVELQERVHPSPTVAEEVASSTTPTAPEAATIAAPQSSVAETSEEAEAIEPQAKQVESTLPPPPIIDAATLEALSQSALVNIFCTMKNGSKVQTVSGSGSFIDARGIILTNAHVGQFFLLSDYPKEGATECVIRTGSPARARYHATLLYLPPAWVEENAAQIAADVARGTGEHDYAFLLVTNVIGESGVPERFPALTMTVVEPKLGTAVLLSAYPAEDLKSRALEKRLDILSAYAGITKLFTFNDEDTVDLFSVRGTEVSQGGSSGGTVVRIYDGRLEGIIVTASTREDTIKRDLRAITLAHIDRSIAAQGEGGLVELLSRDPETQASNFASTHALEEREALIKALED